MRLRAIELTNLRRFAGRRAVLDGIGDGVTVLSEPNEFGKSTFFDALHALFFERHRSRRAPVRALQPHSGGAPEVAVTIELPEGRFRIHKSFLSRAQARVTDDRDRLIAQEDEAEAWIDRLMGGDLTGPSGLLWVRQGVLGIDPDEAMTARRDLLSTVAGEIDMMTGGRRMDAVLDRVGAEMARLATATGRPRAGGEWDRAVKEAEALAEAEGQLRDKALRLSGDLARRAEVTRALARLTEPEAAAARQAALEQARAAEAAARAHADRLSHADRDRSLARLAEDTARQALDRGRQLSDRLTRAAEALKAAEARAETTRSRAEAQALRDQAAGQAHQQAREALRDLRGRLALAQRAQLAHAARGRAAELARALERAEALQARLEEDRAQRARLGVTPAAVARVDQAQAALDRAQARAEAQAVTLEVQADGPPATLPDGRVLGPGVVPLTGRTRVLLPGFGALIVDPGAGQGATLAEALAAARDDLAAALAGCGAADAADARERLHRAARLDEALRQGAQALADLAPEGLEALRAARAQALAEAEDAPEAPEDAAALAPLLTRAEEAETAARLEALAAREALSAANEARAEAEAERRAAARTLEEARAQAGAPEALARQLDEGAAALPALTARLAEAEAAHRALAATAPDLATAEASLRRATSAAEQARRDADQLRQELAALTSRIETLAEEGIEETLARLTDQRQEACARAARYQAEMAALTRLRDALDQARSRQRDAYFQPVLRELHPLLAILHPGAALQIDDRTLLPHALTRDGQAEALDILSGGTREQVAILTRLAFARLFAQAGRPVPVILDDALVHSDDDRIEAMFTALHRVAADQQVLVLTCRQRAFAPLGGTRAHVRVEAL